ncbi:MAG: ComF family protein [Rhodobacterales bacterium]|jgi:ComF family protein|nr:ComF family protein [Rhodobacter sp.]HBN32105.1 amidophosphoribosyltransferase [Paracoccaceae bacterium]
MKLQSAIHFLFPPQCLCCGVETTSDFALCGPCWRETTFVSGLVCDACGIPLPGDAIGQAEHCDACIIAPQPWTKGRAAVMYEGSGRKMILGLKHGDRLDLAPSLADWMVDAAKDLPIAGALVAPVPLFWRRFLRRRYNQSSLLAQKVARAKCADYCPDLLTRVRATRVQEGMTRAERQENQRDAFAVNPRNTAKIFDRTVLLVDDVMTSGATLAACSEACFAAGAADVNVLVLARVARDT